MCGDPCQIATRWDKLRAGFPGCESTIVADTFLLGCLCSCLSLSESITQHSVAKSGSQPASKIVFLISKIDFMIKFKIQNQTFPSKSHLKSKIWIIHQYGFGYEAIFKWVLWTVATGFLAATEERKVSLRSNFFLG